MFYFANRVEVYVSRRENMSKLTQEEKEEENVQKETE